MRTFICRSLGNNCSWKHSAKTEELLVDIVALHLREIHGVKDLSPVMIGKVKNAFSEATPVEMKAADKLVLREFKCRDLGMKCDWHYIAQTEELIVDGVAVHAREAHGITEFTPEMKVKVEKSLQEWKG